MTKIIGAVLLLLALVPTTRADSGVASFLNFGSVTATTPVVISTVDTHSQPTKYYSLQVKASTGAATAWDVRLEGSLDGANWTGILAHSTADGDGTVKVSTNPVIFPAAWVRTRLNSLTFGSSATRLTVRVLGTQ